MTTNSKLSCAVAAADERTAADEDLAKADAFDFDVVAAAQTPLTAPKRTPTGERHAKQPHRPPSGTRACTAAGAADTAPHMWGPDPYRTATGE